MIRFVDLGFQLEPFHGGQRMFAWWDTIHDRFIEFNGELAWSSWEEFTKFEGMPPRVLEPTLLDRLWNLFPDEWEPATCDE